MRIKVKCTEKTYTVSGVTLSFSPVGAGDEVNKPLWGSGPISGAIRMSDMGVDSASGFRAGHEYFVTIEQPTE